MARPTLTLTPRGAAPPVKPAPPAKRAKPRQPSQPSEEAKAKARAKAKGARPKRPPSSIPPFIAVRELALLGLPLFQRMNKVGVLLPMCVGIREQILAIVERRMHYKVVGWLHAIASSTAYQYALHADGSMRHRLDGSIDCAVSPRDHRLAQCLINGGRAMVAADLGLPDPKKAARKPQPKVP